LLFKAAASLQRVADKPVLPFCRLNLLLN